jgi:hypothetical protein
MSNHSRVGGILTIVSGGVGLLGLLLIVFSLLMARETSYYSSYYYSDTMTYDQFVRFVDVIIGFMLTIGGIFCVLAITGGIFALRRKVWGLALTGSIAALFTFFPCGIPALIFTCMGKREFDIRQQPMPTAVGG